MIQYENEKHKEKVQFFQCPICQNVVKDPLECSGCSSLFCKLCIAPWMRENFNCPKKCKGDAHVKFREINRFVMNELQDLRLKCPHQACAEVNVYTEAIKHLGNCSQVMIRCTQGCGLGILGRDMEYHIKKQCRLRD